MTDKRIYRSVADKITKRIHDGAYLRGGGLPGERQLAGELRNRDSLAARVARRNRFHAPADVDDVSEEQTLDERCKHAVESRKRCPD